MLRLFQFQAAACSILFIFYIRFSTTFEVIDCPMSNQSQLCVEYLTTNNLKGLLSSAQCPGSNHPNNNTAMVVGVVSISVFLLITLVLVLYVFLKKYNPRRSRSSYLNFSVRKRIDGNQLYPL